MSIAALVGCVPNATTYYRPTVDLESTHEESHCVPTEKYVHFEVRIPQGALKVRGYGLTYKHGDDEGTEGQYVIDGLWKDIHYQNDVFYLTVPGSDVQIKPIKTYADLFEYATQSKLSSGAVFPKQTSDAFDVHFPPLIVDGTVIDLPVLHIQKTLCTWISPFDCWWVIRHFAQAMCGAAPSIELGFCQSIADAIK